MSVFQVKYRGKDGAVRAEGIESESRAAVLAEIKGRGGVVLSITEGGKISSRPPQPKPSATSHKPVVSSANKRIYARGILAGVLVIILAFGAWFLFFNAEETPAQTAMDEVPPPKSPKATNKNNPQASVHKIDRPKVLTATNPAIPSVAYPTNEHSLKFTQRIIGFTAQTNNDGMVVEKIRTEDGKLHSNIYSSKLPIFEHGTDEQLALALTAKPGEVPPPAPPVDPADEKVFMESLKKPIVINDDDPPSIKTLKEKVIQAREDMAKMIADGSSFEEVLKENRKLQEENATARQTVVTTLKKILDEGDLETARKYADDSNKVLKDMGILPVAIPASYTTDQTTGQKSKSEIMNDRKENEK